MNQLKILIVGGGIAGMSCAISLAKSGHDIHLVDLDPEWRAYGTGITIQPATFRAFRQLGIDGEVLEAGFAAKGTRFRLVDGTILNEVIIDGIEPGLPGGGGIMRPALHRILSQKTVRTGTNISLGITVDALEERTDRIDVHFSNGQVESFDLVIGADGVNSKMRSLLFPDAPSPHFTGQGCFRTLAPRPTNVDMIEVYLGSPIKPGITPVSDKELYMFTLTPEPNGEYYPPEGQNARVREVLQGFGGLIGEIRDSIGPDSQTVYRPLEALILPKPWHKGRVLLVGDAVHSTTPQLASGACCAIEDGLLLADYLDTSGSIDLAFTAFTDRRFERCRDVVESSVLIGAMELAQAPSSDLAAVYAAAMLRLAARA